MIDFNPDFIGHEPPDDLRQQLAAEKLANGKLVASLVGPKLPLGALVGSSPQPVPIVSAQTVASPSVTNLTAAMREFADASRDGITAWLRNIAKVRGMIAQARTIGGMDAACDETELSLKHQLQEVAAHCRLRACVTGWRGVVTPHPNGGKLEVPFSEDNLAVMCRANSGMMGQLLGLVRELFAPISEDERKNSGMPSNEAAEMPPNPSEPTPATNASNP